MFAVQCSAELRRRVPSKGMEIRLLIRRLHAHEAAGNEGQCPNTLTVDHAVLQNLLPGTAGKILVNEKIKVG
jgi:hypothetical protein